MAKKEIIIQEKIIPRKLLSIMLLATQISKHKKIVKNLKIFFSHTKKLLNSNIFHSLDKAFKN